MDILLKIKEKLLNLRKIEHEEKYITRIIWKLKQLKNFEEIWRIKTPRRYYTPLISLYLCVVIFKKPSKTQNILHYQKFKRLHNQTLENFERKRKRIGKPYRPC